MTGDKTEQVTSRTRPRLWPILIIVAVQWLAWFVVPYLAPDAILYGMLTGLVCGLAILVWLLFFSRLPWFERVGVVALMVVAVLATKYIVHESISNGMMGMMLPIYSIPVLSLALVATVVISSRLSSTARRVMIIAAIALACGGFTLLRTGGMYGDSASDLHWRWTPSPEERLLAQAANEKEPIPPPAAPSPSPSILPSPTPTAGEPSASPSPTPVERTPEKSPAWPGFRGSRRDAVVRGVRIESNWSQKKPVELWRRSIGPGWSSFAVNGNFAYTQEQRGDDEMVSCYDLTTGAPVWRHRDAARFWESNAGPGPRGTPTFSNGRIYTFGATGILNALDASNGSVIWSRNAATDTSTKTPGWGFASSPLVVGDIVIVATSGVLAAYDRGTGKLRWIGPSGGSGYSSPHLATIDGVTQVIHLNGEGAISVNPADGKLLWKHDWPSDGIVQPALIEGDVLIGSGTGMGGIGSGVRRIAVKHKPEGWNVEERWTSTGLKPYYNDFVVHKSHAFGFDGSILACIDLNDGKRKWKGGRYGNGQMVVLPDQDLLLVLSEEGELALVSATSDKFTEVAKIPAIEGKTWNHPVLVGDVLLVRNGEEMVAFRLTLAADSARGSP